MTLNELSGLCAILVEKSENNYIQSEQALEPSLVGTRLFDVPLLAAATADDPLFEEYIRHDVIGPHSTLPVDWLEGARTVLSIFLPFSKELRESNRQKGEPSAAWVHGRYEGQAFVEELCSALADGLLSTGEQAVVPALDPHCWNIQDAELDNFTSNWSERHAAYAAGLGTFGISKGLITKVGTAGRIGSVATTLYLPPTPRDYTDIYDYCNNCMAYICFTLSSGWRL